MDRREYIRKTFSVKYKHLDFPVRHPNNLLLSSSTTGGNWRGERLIISSKKNATIALADLFSILVLYRSREVGVMFLEYCGNRNYIQIGSIYTWGRRNCSIDIFYYKSHKVGQEYESPMISAIPTSISTLRSFLKFLSLVGILGNFLRLPNHPPINFLNMIPRLYCCTRIRAEIRNPIIAWMIFVETLVRMSADELALSCNPNNSEFGNSAISRTTSNKNPNYRMRQPDPISIMSHFNEIMRN